MNLKAKIIKSCHICFSEIINWITSDQNFLSLASHCLDTMVQCTPGYIQMIVLPINHCFNCPVLNWHNITGWNVSCSCHRCFSTQPVQKYGQQHGDTIVILLHFLSNKNQHTKYFAWSSIKQKLIRFINDGLRKYVGL